MSNELYIFSWSTHTKNGKKRFFPIEQCENKRVNKTVCFECTLYITKKGKNRQQIKFCLMVKTIIFFRFYIRTEGVGNVEKWFVKTDQNKKKKLRLLVLSLNAFAFMWDFQ